MQLNEEEIQRPRVSGERTVDRDCYADNIGIRGTYPPSCSLERAGTGVVLQHVTDKWSQRIRPNYGVHQPAFMTKTNLGRRLPLSGSGEALFRLSFFPDEIGAGPCLSLSSTFFLKHVLMPWTIVAIAMGVGLTGRGLPSPVLRKDPNTSSPHPVRPPPPPPGAGAVMAISDVPVGTELEHRRCVAQ